MKQKRQVIFHSQINRIFQSYNLKLLRIFITCLLYTSIRLGSSITAGAFLVPERAARFQEHYPECRLEVSVQNSGKVIRQVLKNELDLGVIEDRAEERCV